MTNRRIVILGFMACGKTTVAREVAGRLHSRFIDLDSAITRQTHRSPAEIITADGEESFREIEHQVLMKVLDDARIRVIALGGGTWTVAANRELIASHNCLTVWLDAPFDLCWKRINSSQAVRPLAPNRETALDRYQTRLRDYGLAEQRIAVQESDAIPTIAEQILKQT